MEGPIPGQIDCADVELALEEYDGIDLSTLEKECPLYFKIMNNLLNNTEYSPNWMCNMLNEMNDSDPENFTYNFEIVDIDETWPGIPWPSPSPLNTVPNGSDRTTTTFIDRSLCEVDCDDLDQEQVLFLTSKFIHESFHAYFNSWVLNDPRFDDIDLIPSTLFNPNSTYFRNAAQLHLDMQTAPVSMHHHALFYQFLYDEVLSSIYALNNNFGNIDDYAYLAHLILNTQNTATNQDWSSELGLNNFDLSDYENDWNNILSTTGFRLCD